MSEKMSIDEKSCGDYINSCILNEMINISRNKRQDVGGNFLTKRNKCEASLVPTTN